MTTTFVNLADFRKHLEEAKKKKIPVEVLRMASTTLKDRGTEVEVWPAVTMSFVIQFDDGRRYLFRETLEGNDRGRVDFNQSELWQQLCQGQDGDDYELRHRSGSL